MTPQSFTAEARAAGERLDVYLAAALQRPRSQVQRLVRTNLVLVNGEQERTSYLVQAGDVVQMQEPPAPAAKAAPPEMPIIYEDDDLVIIDKPAGIAVHPGAASHVTATVADFARPRTSDQDPDRPGIVHRLDRDTSGILIIAKNEAAKTFMQAAFKRREVRKTYELLVVGRIDKQQAVIKLPLGRDPAGIAVHPGAASHVTATVADFARPRTSDQDPDRPGIVHRLDRDTSGILIIAKNEAAKAFMQAAFKRRGIHKTYDLLVVGRIDKEQAVIKLPLGRDPAHPLQQAVEAAGREALTPYIATRYYNGYTQIQAKPETGRTHQLRVHFAALGHPVAGDIVYGPPKRPIGLKRQFLHASTIEFTAPSGKLVKLASPIPPDLQIVLDRLEEESAA